MDNAFLVGRGKSVRQGHGELEELRQIEPVGWDQSVQAVTHDSLHGQKFAALPQHGGDTVVGESCADHVLCRQRRCP